MKSMILTKMQNEMRLAMINESDLRKKGITDGKIFEALLSVKYIVRSALSILPDMDIKPENATDDDMIEVLKKVIFKEKTSELYNQKILTEKDVVGLSPKELISLTKEKIFELGEDLKSMNIGIAETYLPKHATKEEIKQWIIENIDFSKFNNKMQAMKPTIKHFKRVDGLIVNNIITGL